MATRLYPAIRKVLDNGHTIITLPPSEIMEVLSGVAPGTARRLTDWKAIATIIDILPPKRQTIEVNGEQVEGDMACFRLRRDIDPEADKLHSFELCGWGKCRFNTRSYGNCYTGSAWEEEQINKIFTEQGVCLTPFQRSLIGGLMWA